MCETPMYVCILLIINSSIMNKEYDCYVNYCLREIRVIKI